MTVAIENLARPRGPAVGRAPAGHTAGAAMTIVALLLAGPLPMLLKLGRSLWDREQYQFFPLMVVGAIAVAHDRWPDVTPRRPGSTWATGGLLGAALAVLVVAALLWVRSMALVSTLLILAAVAWRAGGWRALRAMTPALVLLAICTPPPGHQEQVVTLRLQHLAVSVSCRLLDVLRVPNVQAGAVIEIPGKRLLIEQACSGINSLMAVLAFTLLYGFWMRRSLARLAVLLPAAMLFVVGGNVARITLEAVLFVRGHVDVLEGFAHMMLGLLLFAGCVGLVASLDALLGGATADAGPAPVSRPRPVPAVRPGRAAWAAAGVFAAAGLWVQTRVWGAWADPALPATATFDLPPAIDGWQQVKAGAMFVERPQTEAAKSAVWEYRRGDTFASVAIDYPFTGYHELTTCYWLSGWFVHTEAADPAGFTRCGMTKPAGAGYLVFGQVDEAGRPRTAAAPADLSNVAGWVRTNLAIARRTAVSGPSYQVQVLMQSPAPAAADARRAADDLYRDASRDLTRQLLAQIREAR